MDALLSIKCLIAMQHGFKYLNQMCISSNDQEIVPEFVWFT